MADEINPTGGDDIGDIEVGLGELEGGEAITGGATTEQTPATTNPSATPTINPPTSDDGVVPVPKEEWERVRQATEEFERQKVFENTVSSIKKDIPDFDVSKVVKKLQEINTKDPAKAQMYNSEVGFRLLWKEMSENVAKNDPVNGGNAKGGGGSFDEVFESAMQGKQGALKKALEMAL